MSDVEFRQFELEDIDNCSELFHKVFSAEPWLDKWEPAARIREFLDDIINTPGFRGYVAIYEGKLIGLILGHKRKWWQGDEYMLEEMCVDPEAQQEGIGGILMEYAEENLKREDVNSIITLTAKDYPAEKFYGKHGFEHSLDTILMYRLLEKE